MTGLLSIAALLAATPTTAPSPSPRGTATPQPAEPPPVATPDSIVADGIPPVPAAVAAALGPYTEFRGATFLSWHPDGRDMLIATRFGDTVQLHRVAAARGARTQLTFFPDRVANAAYTRAPLGGGSPLAVFSKDAGGNEFYQSYRFDTDGGAVTLLTDGRSRNSLGVFSRRGSRLAYTSTRRTGADTDLYVIDAGDPSPQKTDKLLAEVKGGGWSVLDWSPGDDKLLVREMISVNESFLWSFDVATGARTPLTPRPEGGEGGKTDKVAYQSGRWASDGRSIYVTTDRDSEWFRLARVELATGRHTYLSTHIPWDIEELDLSKDGKQLAAIANEDGVGRLRLFDARTGKERPAPKLPAGTVTGVGWHPNGRLLAVTLSSARMSADVFVADTRAGRVQRWTESELGPVDLRDLPEPELIKWRSFDGRELSGLLYRPPPRFAGRRPVMVNIHGGPESQARPLFLGRHNYLLAELGVAILYPNVRGSTGYGKTFTKLDNALLREDPVKDIGALLDWVKTRPDLDADRILVSGGSYGGFMSLAVASRYADRIRCSVDIVGISNFVTFLEKTEAYRRDLRRVEYGDERDPATRAFMQRIAPVNNAASIAKPILVVQGKNDPRVPLAEAEQIVATLRKRGTKTWYLMARDEGHGFAKKRNADYLSYVLVTFIQKHLLD
jgi:dipeptidyl aminopeptidase/acylaminoacyl peptidase